MSSHRQLIVKKAFSQASNYDRHARVQRKVAQQLAARIAGLPLPENPQILEIGCGTGFLTEALVRQGLGGEWLVTDLSAQMVDRCRRRIGSPDSMHFAVLDAEYGEPEDARRFDLICSSLAVQWFDDLAAAIPRMLDWLVPGGQCLFTTLGEGTFAEWRAAHLAEGLACGTPHFPASRQLNAMQPAAREFPHRVDLHVENHRNARDFLHALKAIGAATPVQGYRPLCPSELRRVMRAFESAGARVTYEVVTCHYLRRLEG